MEARAALEGIRTEHVLGRRHGPSLGQPAQLLSRRYSVSVCLTPKESSARQRKEAAGVRASHEESSSGRSALQLTEVLAKSLWGKGLPPGALVQVVRNTWTLAWSVMMGQLAPQSAGGAYTRPKSEFRGKVQKGGKYPPEAGRYHLYAALSCPWAHRTLIVHSLKGLANVVPVSVAVPGDSGLWEFRPGKQQQPLSGLYEGAAGQASFQPTNDRANGCERLKDVYGLRSGGYDGRSSVPMVWDTIRREVVNNESADIIEMLNSSFNDYAEHPELELAPEHAREQMDAWNAEIYENVNNGVYRCGFATSQDSYTKAVTDLFLTLDKLDEHLRINRYICGNSLTLADVRLFTTLYRFDPVYHTLFKCSRQKIAEYEHLGGYLRELYQMPAVAATCDMDAIMRSYFGSLFPLNPGGIVPLVPSASTATELLRRHDRAAVTSMRS